MLSYRHEICIAPLAPRGDVSPHSTGVILGVAERSYSAGRRARSARAAPVSRRVRETFSEYRLSRLPSVAAPANLRRSHGRVLGDRRHFAPDFRMAVWVSGRFGLLFRIDPAQQFGFGRYGVDHPLHRNAVRRST